MAITVPNDSNPLTVVDTKNLTHRDTFGEIQALYNEAEGAIKSFEHVEGLFIPTVNQLRYAGRHIVDFLSGAKPDLEELNKAKCHCQRAVYDAHDAHIQLHLMEIQGFEKDFSEVVITDIVDNWFDILEAKQSALVFLEEGRTKGDGRASMYEACRTIRENLQELTKRLPMARNELNKIVTGDRKKSIGMWIGSIATFIGMIVAIIALIVQLS